RPGRRLPERDPVRPSGGQRGRLQHPAVRHCADAPGQRYPLQPHRPNSAAHPGGSSLGCGEDRMRLGISSYTYVWAVGVPGYPAPPRRLTAHQLLGRADELGVWVVKIAATLPLGTLSEPELDPLVGDASRGAIALEVGTRGLRPDPLRRYIAIAA